MSGKFISVIIPAHNAEKTIIKCAESLMGLDYPDYEVIIVNDGSTDGTAAALKDFEGSERLKVLNQEKSGPSVARNRAIMQAKGDFIAFTDADCKVDKNWLNELLKGFEVANPYRIMGAGGDQLSPEDDTDFGKQLNDFLRNIGFLSDYIKTSTGTPSITATEHNPTCNAMYRKEVFDKVGYFQEDLWPGEDVELDYRIKKSGFQLMFNPAAIVYHYRPENASKYRKMMFRYGNVQALLVRKYGFFRKIQYVPFILIFLILTLMLASIVSLLSVIELLALQLFLFAVSFYINTKNAKKAPVYLYLFVQTILAWNAGFAAGIFSKKKI
ncbi:MAG: glycosyltransferase [Elusimicrobiota bacterium]